MLRRPRIRGGNNLPLMALVLAAVGVLAAAGSQLQDAAAPPRAPTTPAAAEEEGETLTMAWSAPPESLDPAFAEDPTGATLVVNLFDPLVKLGPRLDPRPAAAEAWEASRDGRRYTFRLRSDMRWTNGSRVTAHDYAYAWKRVLDPRTGSPRAGRLFGIAGASQYNACVEETCSRLGRHVGIRAPDARTLVVDLVSRRPWFPAETAHPAFLPVHRGTVERLGEGWGTPDALVTNGPFTLETADEAAIVLVKNGDFRAADAVTLGRVTGRVLTDPRARVQAFDAGAVMALDAGPLPASELPSLREREEYEVYPALVTHQYAFNLKTVRDVNQRRAMALAVNRAAIVANVVQADVLPATRFTPSAAPGFAYEDESPWLPAEGDAAAAVSALRQATSIEEEITLLYVDAPDNRAVALAVRDAWRGLGLDVGTRAETEEEQRARGGVPGEAADVFQLDLQYPYAEAEPGLAPWTCEAARATTGFCRKRFDRLLARARRAREPAARQRLYAEAEAVLSGPDGALPGIPVFWHTHANLESLSVRDTFHVDAFGRIDLAGVRVE